MSVLSPARLARLRYPRSDMRVSSLNPTRSQLSACQIFCVRKVYLNVIFKFLLILVQLQIKKRPYSLEQLMTVAGNKPVIFFQKMVDVFVN